MKITFLGTSHGVPSAERYCTCSMIETGGFFYFIDAGTPLIDQLIRRGVNLDQVKAIFTTHLHGDHTDGILHLADLFTWYYKSTSIDIYLTEEKAPDLFRALISAMCGLDDERVRFRVMTPNTVFDDGHLRLTPIPTKHIDAASRPSYAYLVEADGQKVLFSGDLSNHLQEADFPAIATKEALDLMVCEMAHFSIDEIKPYLEQCKAKEMLFNHVFPLHKLEQVEALNGVFDYPIHILADGDVWEAEN